MAALAQVKLLGIRIVPSTRLPFRLGGGSELSDRHRVLRSAPDRHRGGDRRRAVAAVDAVDPEVRVQLLADQRPGIPVAGEFGALPFIWGTLYSSVLALASWPRRSRSASRCSSPSCRPAGCAQPLVFLTELLAAIPSIVYGLWGIFVLVPCGPRARRWHMPECAASDPLFSGPPLGVGMLAAGLILAVMVIPFTVVGRPRSAEGGAARAARGRLRARRDALRSDPRGAVLRAHRHHRRRHAGLRPRARRDDGGDHGDRQQPAGVAVAVRAAVHDGRGHRQRVHRGGRRALPARAGRDRPRAVHHHADRSTCCRGC